MAKSPKEYAQELAFLPQQHLVPEGIKVHEFDRLRAFALLKPLGVNSAKKDEELVNWAMTQTQTAELAEQLVSDLSGGLVNNGYF